MKPWKPEFVELLRKNIEECRNVDFINNSSRKEDPVSESLSSYQSSSNTKVKDVIIKKKKKSVKKGKNKKMGHIRRFQPEEDTILMSTKLESNMEIAVVAKQLDRNPRSIETRIHL